MIKKVLLVIGILVLLLVIGCDSNSDFQREEAIVTRSKAFARAEALYPVPWTQNFPMRQALVKYTERQDLINHPYYIYVLADTGNIIGYYVAQSQPVNINAFLSSTQDTYGADGRVVLDAPSLDGIFYGGAGASASDGWFFFDAETDALVILYGVKLFVADQPLRIEAKPITVNTEP